MNVPESSVEKVVREALDRGRRLRRRRSRLRIGLTGTVAAAVLAGTIVLIGSAGSSKGGSGPDVTSVGGPSTSTTATTSPTSTTTTSPAAGTTTLPSNATGPPGGVVPADFQPSSFTAVSLDEWWLLGTGRCLTGTGTCGAIVRTTDGGSKFSGIPSPPVSASAVTQLGYANELDGYAFDPELWETTNGGSSWVRIALSGATVTELETADGETYALACAAGSARCQSPELLRSALGSRRWEKVPTPVALGVGAEIALSGPNLYVLSGSGRASLLYSDDRGASFSQRADPCTASLGGRVTATADGTPTLWAACPTGTEAEAWVSTNGGAGWRPEAGGFDNHMQLTAASAAVALAWPAQAAPGASPNALEETTDGGASFSVVLSGSASLSITWAGYSDPDRAYALLATSDSGSAVTSRLYESDDGGATWSAVAIGS